MANKLLAEREAGTVGINWPDNFVRRKEELKRATLVRTIDSEPYVRIGQLSSHGSSLFAL